MLSYQITEKKACSLEPLWRWGVGAYLTKVLMETCVYLFL